MPSIRILLVSCLLLVQISSYVITEPAAPPRIESEDETKSILDFEAFQRLLDQVDPPALHQALHNYSPKKFKHGVFKEDRTAVEAVHRDNAPLATSIAVIARRQDVTNSSSTPIPPVVVTVTSVDSTITITSIPTLNPSTVAPNPVQPSDRSTQKASAVPLPGPTTAAVPSASVQPGGPVASPSVPIAPGPVIPLTSGAVLTTTNAAGVTVITTIDGGVVTLSGAAGAGPSDGASTSSASASAPPTIVTTPQTAVVLQTTTLADGSQSTITAVTVVPAGNTLVPTPSGSAGVLPTITKPPAGLQSGLAPKTRGCGWEAVGVLAGAVGFAMVL